MTPERYQKIGKLVHAAIELEPQQRAIFLDAACAGDEELRREVESLIASDEQVGNLFATPALEVAAGMMAELAWSDSLPNLRVLGLSSSNFQGVVELARSPLAKRLTHLDLSYVPMGESEAKLFLDRSTLPRLVYLALRGVKLEPATTAALQQCWGQRLNVGRRWRWLVG